jgi:hypothetical protein
MEELSAVLFEATRAIDAMYFRLQIDGGDPVYRERVYCYELYHQMRLRWPRGCPFYLNGEIDKAAHPILVDLGAGQTKPDLLVHRPGYMTDNYAIIEVKNTRTRLSGLRKDLNTLTVFLTRIGYRRGIYLLYGDEPELVKRIAVLGKGMGGLPPIEIWMHEEPGCGATHVVTIGS